MGAKSGRNEGKLSDPVDSSCDVASEAEQEAMRASVARGADRRREDEARVNAQRPIPKFQE